MSTDKARYLTVGMLAHVDAGKTTLSEALLYRAGCLKRLGRVDHQDAFLDTDALERERGITIFSKQAILPLEGVTVTLLDTPGHVDFSAEAERVLPVLDCAVLVISGTDGVQGHTETLWKLLETYQVPVFLFVNKTDLAGTDRGAVLAQLRQHFGDGCVPFDRPLGEEAAVCSEELLEQYLEQGALSDAALRRAVGERKLFPCWFGSALRLEGVDGLLHGLERFAPVPDYGPDFGARVFKISRDPQGNRLTWLKLTGGTLRVKEPLSGEERGVPWSEKADQLRLYSGARFQAVNLVEAGMVCAVTGLTHTRPGQGLGVEPDGTEPILTPVMTCQVLLPDGLDAHTVLSRLRELEEEDPQLHAVWNRHLGEIHVQLMGPVQVEILKRRLSERYGLEVSFGPGHILYRETIAAPVTGVGHFEPLRHYAEVHLLLEPGEPGSGIQIRSACDRDQLEVNWQRLILTHLAEREHLGVLTGSPVTDLVITLLAGKAHLKHTEGGDFREASYRAVRQGLRRAESVLLEPWYEVQLDLPADCLGRAMSDLQQRSGDFAPPEQTDDRVTLRGIAPASEMGDYANEVVAYTRGRGQLSLLPGGYRPCHNADEVISAIGYDPDSDVENTADSVFCAHGAGFLVRWDQVAQYQHLETPDWETPPPEPEPSPPPVHRPGAYAAAAAQDRELQAIFEQTYGPVRRRSAFDSPSRPYRPLQSVTIRDWEPVEEYLLVDGYNIIFSWDDLNRLAKNSMDRARQSLMDDLCSYQAVRQCRVILVFDAYRVKGGVRHVEQYHNIHVVYTQEAETADQYIEQASYKLGKHYRVRVATSDGLEQIIVLGHGCLRVSARAFREEMDMVKDEIRRAMDNQGT
ncbi:MAG: TetM/TetW/TetO/TetS family tetracycline resistance ribosomal protection protein [Clostridiales bacterium]|nr:TetM/TetW/TetO/TetS family tetracycline resistance ribosomal protection protein [Clostridiales bacterium]